MTASIRIDDSVNPPVQTTDNPSTFLATVHTVSNFDDTGVLGHRWTLTDKPAGSSATLSSTSAPTTTISPDISGSYVIRLETYTDAARTILDDVDEQIVGVRFPPPLDWLLPGAGETTQQDATAGWKTEVNRFLSEVRRQILKPSSSTVTTGPRVAGIGERVLYDPSGGTFTISAPASPTKDDRFSIKNTTVDVTSMTISGNGTNIEDPSTSTFLASFALATALVSIDFLFDGTNWIIV
jgi:hypothetical protein